LETLPQTGFIADLIGGVGLEVGRKEDVGAEHILGRGVFGRSDTMAGIIIPLLEYHGLPTERGAEELGLVRFDAPLDGLVQLCLAWGMVTLNMKPERAQYHGIYNVVGGRATIYKAMEIVILPQK